MNNKWYISALIFALAILGISLEQNTVPNQEIVIQFENNEITSIETQNAIDVVKKQLESVAVENINIQELGNGTLKITYHSDVEVSEIKKIFSESIEVAYSHTSDKEDTDFPFEKELKTYQIDVYEIQNNIDLISYSGNVVDVKSEIIRFFTPDVYAIISKQVVEGKDKSENIAYTCYKNIAIAINNTECEIPDVRAGPLV